MKSPCSRVERLIIWGLAAALAAFSVFCIFWTPYDQARLLRAVPANAAIISTHHDLGPRLESLVTNIFLKTFFDSKDSALSELFRVNRRVARIALSPTVMAYGPGLNQFTTRGDWPSDPVLVISSWVGGWAPVLRWALWICPPKDIALLGEYDGHRLWAFKKTIPFLGTANFFSFAIDEGVLIGCLSRDRKDIVHLMRIYDGRADSILPVRRSPRLRDLSAVALAKEEACSGGRRKVGAGGSEGQCRFAGNASALDQVWLRFHLPYSPPEQSLFALCALDVLENDYLAATIRFEPAINLEDYIGQQQGLAEARKISASSPPVVALFPSAVVADGLNGLVAPAWAEAIKPVLSQTSGTNNICLLMVFTGDYGGKFGKEPFRIAVPTVLLAVAGARPEQTKTAVLELLDFINRKYRPGLILNPALPPAGQIPFFTVESTAGGILRALPPEDQPAFAFYNGWFLLASNSAGLRKLLFNFQSGSGGAVAGNNDWLKQVENRNAKAFIWIDPNAGGKALRFALTASIIMLNTDARNQSNQNAIRIIKTVRSWLENISSLKNCAAWMESEDGKSVLRLEIGAPNPL